MESTLYFFKNHENILKNHERCIIGTTFELNGENSELFFAMVVAKNPYDKWIQFTRKK